MHDRLSIIAGEEGEIEYGNGICVAIDRMPDGPVARVAITARWTQAELIARTKAAAPEPAALVEDAA